MSKSQSHLQAASSQTYASNRASGEVDAKLLQLLICPITKGPLTYQKDTHELWSRGSRLAFPIRSGVPVMLPEEARSLTDKEIESLKE